ncbi:MAG: phosphohydrolase, partial [Betaproteobacteria bacterium]
MHSKVAVKDLKIGMFVADLDRPWIDTPFLIQGFLIVDRQQIAELQRICEFVVIDRARSTGAEFRKPEGARPESAATPPPPKSRLTSAITSSLEEAPTAKEDLKKVAPP